MKINFTFAITLFIFFTGTTTFSQNLTREEVDSKLPGSWTAIEKGKPGEELSPNKNNETIDVRADGSLTLERYTEIMGFSTSEMLWGFSESDQKIITTVPTGGLSESLEFEIIELTNDKLVLMSSEQQTVYIPTNKTKQEASGNPNDDNTNNGLMPGPWSGKLPYNIIITTDHYNNKSRERVPGVITLEKLGEKKIIRKKELGSTVTWTINNTTYIANVTRYDAICSDLNLNGEITFQNGFMLLEIYEPKYSSYLWAVE